MASSLNQLNRFLDKWHHGAAVLLALFAFCMSALISERVYERLPHLEDELAYLFQARIFAGGQVVIDSPHPANSFWQPFVVDYEPTGKRFGKYTPGWPAVLAVGTLLGQEWFINAALAALVVALVFRLGKEIFNADVGLIAALLTAFSPAALLLNGSLMAHTAALFFSLLFVYGIWRIERGRQALRWGIVAGIGLGMLAATRPVTTLAIALPFIVWSGVRVGVALVAVLRGETSAGLRCWQMLAPLILLSCIALFFAASVPAFSAVATGDPGVNLYELVWGYDRIGFGECCGRNGHNVLKGFRHARYDLSLTSADLFGWQLDPITPELVAHLQNDADYFEATSFGFVLLPVGLALGMLGYSGAQGRRWRLLLIVIWTVGALAWSVLPVENHLPSIFSEQRMTDPAFSWFWVLLGLAWLYAPLVLLYRWRKSPQIPYTWLMAALVLGIVLIQMLYWVGSQRYSTRYYYEALAAAALLTALPLGWLAQRLSRPLTYALLLLISVAGLYHYSTPRIMALYGYNLIERELVDQVEARRQDERSVLVLVNGETSGDQRVRWRAYGALMGVTSPYLNSPIVVARDYGGRSREQLLMLFPDRQIIELFAVENKATFIDEPAP
jgi:MFS family permease